MKNWIKRTFATLSAAVFVMSGALGMTGIPAAASTVQTDREVSTQEDMTVYELSNEALLGATLESPSKKTATETVLMNTTKSGVWQDWDHWVDLYKLDASGFKKNLPDAFTFKIAYTGGAPFLIFQGNSYNTWAQIPADYVDGGVAYYTYESIVGQYGSDDFSTLNALVVRLNEADATITKISYVAESAGSQEICVNLAGPAGEIVNSISAGWNLGNTFDSYGTWIEQAYGNQPTGYETAWGNPVTTEAMIKTVKDAGFNAIRVPVTWSQHIGDAPNYTVDSAWMNRVQEVVDYCIDNDMYCLLNVHHDTGTEGWLRASTSNYNSNNKKYAALWRQIATRFKNYDNHLLFEGFNEMLNESNNWGYPGKDGTTAINQYNQLFVDTVRATGGNNATRVLVVNTYAASGDASVLADFVLPTDTVKNSLIVQIHYYDPNAYCFDMEGDQNTQTVWKENSGEDTMNSKLKLFYRSFTSKGIPVIIGEVGVGYKNNDADRADFFTTFFSKSKTYGIKCFIWDNGGKMDDADYHSMGLLNRRSNTWAYPTVINAIKEYLGLKDAANKCGDNAYWNLDETTGVMSITGSGPMYDYLYSTRTPWVKVRDKIKKVTVASAITTIGTNSFYNCANLTTVTGCANVTDIGINSFRNCTSLTLVQGCSKVKQVQQYAFCGATKFGTLGPNTDCVSLPACEKIGGYAFYECAGIKSLKTYSPLTYLGTRAFSNSTAMTTAQIGANCETIGSFSFCGCTALTTVTGCTGVKGIGQSAFNLDAKLVSVSGLSKLTSVGHRAFQNCTSLRTIGATAGVVRLDSVIGIGDYGFSGCKSITSFVAGTGLKQIETYAFQNNTSMNSLKINSTVLGLVEDYAFKGIKSGCVIYVPSSKLTSYKNGVLAGRGQSSTVTIKAI